MRSALVSPPGHAWRRGRRVCWVWVLAALWLAGGELWERAAFARDEPRRKPAPRKTERYDRKLGLATFDEAWAIIYRSHFDTNFNGVDWPALRDSLRPAAVAATNETQLREVVQRMLNRLTQSHMSLIPREAAESSGLGTASGKAAETGRARKKASARRVREPKGEAPKPGAVPAKSGAVDADPSREGDVGLEVRIVDGQVVVFRVEPGGPAGRAGVRPGWVIRSIDGEPRTHRLASARDDAERRRFYFLAWSKTARDLLGTPGTAVEVSFLDGNDRPVELRLERQQQRGQPAKLGNLPTMYAHFEKRLLGPLDHGGIGWMHFNLWMLTVAGDLERAVEEFAGCQGMVIDMRGNLGGVGGMIMGVAGHFLPRPVSLGTMKTRTAELRFNANPRRVSASGKRVEPFSGPVAILVDAISLSAAEVFAGGMQDIQRARVFGETSAGQALPALFDRLPNGDVLYHAFADFTTPSGGRLEGRGVVPDETIPLRRRSLLEGRDEVLEAATHWIRLEASKP